MQKPVEREMAVVKISLLENDIIEKLVQVNVAGYILVRGAGPTKNRELAAQVLRVQLRAQMTSSSCWTLLSVCKDPGIQKLLLDALTKVVDNNTIKQVHSDQFTHDLQWLAGVILGLTIKNAQLCGRLS